MREQIQSYLEAHESAWSVTTWNSERSRLNAISEVIDKGPETLHKVLTIQGKKPYTIKTTFIRVCALEIWIGKDRTYQDYMKKFANRFKHAYQKKELEITFDDAARKIESLGGATKRAAQVLLRTGLRISETDHLIDDRVVGKGGKVRKVFGGAEKFECSKAELRKALQSLGLRPHDLRKLLATKLGESGASAADLCKIFGWSDIKTAYVYLQSKDDDRMQQFIEQAIR
jgi:hypothetical protein